MQYYTFRLDEEYSNLCTLVTPFGKSRYQRLPMGLKCAPDYAQEVMKNICCDLKDTDVYIDKIGAFLDKWKDHLALLNLVCGRLVERGLTVIPLKCERGVKEPDWLGYWLTPKGLEPWKKNVDSIIQMSRPENLKQLRGIEGAVNYYRNMWPHRSHGMAPLTDQTGKKTFVWSPDMETAFKQMKIC